MHLLTQGNLISRLGSRWARPGLGVQGRGIEARQARQASEIDQNHEVEEIDEIQRVLRSLNQANGSWIDSILYTLAAL